MSIEDIDGEPDPNILGKPCSACGTPSEGYFSIHRDGFCEGPEVPLCNGCGAEETPTTGELWHSIAGRGTYAHLPLGDT